MEQNNKALFRLAAQDEIKSVDVRAGPDENTEAKKAWIRSFIDRHNIEVVCEYAKDGKYYFELSQCPFNLDHRKGAIIASTDGFGYKCFHASCADHHWKELRALFEKRSAERPSVCQDFENYDYKSQTDLGNSLRFERMFRERLRYCTTRGAWFIYMGGVWRQDELNAVMTYVDACIKSIFRDAVELDDKKERSALIAHGKRTEALQRRKAMLEGACYMMAVREQDLDRDSMMFNASNGTIDLQTGLLLEHNSKDLITMQAPVIYDPDATCPRFDQFLTEIFPDSSGLGIGNTEVIRFVQKFIGYCLSGNCNEQVMAVAWGSGANGKSTLLGVLQEMFGNYATTSPTEMLLVKRNEGIPNDIARLRGVRFVTASETAEGRRMNTALIKQLTGQDQMTARFLRCEFFTFVPQFKLVLITNHTPSASGDDAAFWRRVRLIPFTERFEGATMDKNLGTKLRQEWPGILRWCVAGCLLWQKEGLNPPNDIVQATADYRSENDIISDWVNEHCEIGEELKSRTAVLFQDFRTWLVDNGERSLLSQAKFTQTLISRGFTSKKDRTGQRLLQGMHLKPEQNKALSDFSSG